MLKTLKDNAEVVKDLGAYETVSRASAVQPHGLLQVRHLLEDITEVSPTCDLQASVLRTALMNLLTSNISLNNTQFNGNTWSNQKAERITVLLCHTRKVARDKEVQRICAAKLTAREYQLLEAVTSKIIQKEEEALEKGTKSDSETALYSETSLQKLFRCIQKLFRCIRKLLYSETISSYSETISSYSETISSYSETISSYSETISSYSETIFVVFRNYSRRIQKLFSSYSETIFVVFRNFYSQTRGQCEQSHAWTVDAYSGWGGGVGLGQ